MKHDSIFIAVVLVLFVFASTGDTWAATHDKPNILFIAIDDLRPELGCYGSEIANTPNLDSLAAEGLLFNRAYCQQAICGPSRCSLMSGLRPDSCGVVHNDIRLRQVKPDLVTVSQHFIANGYDATFVGKIFHGKDTDEALSWSRKPVGRKAVAELRKKWLAEDGNEGNKNEAATNSMSEKLSSDDYLAGVYGESVAWTCMDVPKNGGAEGGATDVAIATLQDMVAGGDKPFFLGLGFKKPHLNWDAPKHYWDLYDRADIPLTQQVNPPEDGATMGLHASFELRTRDGVPKIGDFNDEQSITYKHAYLACVSYVDAQIGRMIAALDEAGVRDNTIIIVWSDHGWHLGEMGVWGKATNYEIATRVPLMIWTPDMPADNRGKKTDALVELVDMYPTLCDLAGLDIPEVDGHSFKPLLENPDQSWKTAAFSQFPCPALREWAAQPLTPDKRETFFGPLIEEVEARIIAQQQDKWDRELFEQNLTGYAMRTDQYRLVLWKDVTKPDAEPLFVELYDHQADPVESKNVADENPEIVKTLTAQFNAGWKASLPQ